MMKLREAVAALLLTSPAGFSTAETTAVIAATSILSATATPHIQEYLENAKTVKAIGDTRVIALSIVRLASDVQQIRSDQTVPPSVLVTEGEVPAAANPDARPWTRAVEGREVQPLAAHLMSNDAGYPIERGHPRRWRGPYMVGLSPDPWGSRYAVNVGLLEGTGGHAVVVVSPGPNGAIETPFEAVGLQPGGDDVIGLIGRGR
jgi:hypothetical protein